MNLRGIKLQSGVIADLYKKTLVSAEMPAKPEKEASVAVPAIKKKQVAEQFHFLGDNKKNILILVNYSQVKHLPDEELAFLTNMLSACKLSLADTAIVNLDKTGKLANKDILTKINSSIILLFGIAPSTLELPVEFPQFQVQSFNQRTFLYIPPLEEIKIDKILKSKLWVCLRKIFNI